MGARGGLQELSRDPDAWTGLADRAFQEIPHAEFAADLARIDGLTFVGEGRVPGDDEEPPDPAQGRGDVLHDAVGEVLLVRIAAHVAERENGYRGFFGGGA